MVAVIGGRMDRERESGLCPLFLLPFPGEKVLEADGADAVAAMMTG